MKGWLLQILEALNILEGFPLAEWGHNSERSLHCFIEATKLAAADRALNVRGAEDTPTEQLLSKVPTPSILVVYP